MIQDVWWIWMWAISGGAPFKWTITVNGLNYANVTCEASLAKVVLPATAGDKHAKATVWSAQYGPVTSTGSGIQQSSNNWGMDGSPIQYLPNCSYMTFALEVNGAATYAAMVGKVYFH